MSEVFDKNNYFSIKSEDLKLNKRLTFDCYIFLEKNGKLVQFFREGAEITPEVRAKLEKLGNPPLLIMHTQRTAYIKYLSLQVISTGSGGIKQGVVVTEKKVFGNNLTPPATQTISPSTGSATSTGAATPPASPKFKIDVDFINILIKTTQKVFQDHFSLALKLRPPTKRNQDSKSVVKVDVVAFLSLTTQSIRGTIGLCFPMQTYVNIINFITESEMKDLSSDLYFGCGEFLHLIFDAARPFLIDRGYSVDQAVPILAVGSNISLPHIIPDQGFSIVFDSTHGPFSFEIGFKTGA